MGGLEKRVLRREFLSKRRLLTKDEVNQRSQLVLQQVMAFLSERPSLQVIHTFLPIERNREVNTWPLVRALAEKGYELVISATNFEDQSMSHFYYESGLDFEFDRLGIPTPLTARPALLSACQCLFMPLVVADKEGGRIGYGGGYYDRLLEGTGEVLKVGLSLGPLLDRLTLLEPHDVRMDYCITPTETIDCKHG